jgi:hypothetical protein
MLALLAMVLVGAALTLLASLTMAEHKEVEREVDRIRLTALCDAGLAESLADLAGGGGGDVPERELGGGTFRAEVFAPGAGRRTVSVRAAYRGRERFVRAEVDVSSPRPRVLDWRVVPAALVSDADGGF